VTSIGLLGPYDFSRIDFQLKTSAGRYEGGTQNMAGFIGLGAGVEYAVGLRRYPV